MDLSRDSIERKDFPRSADGLDPEAVAEHLRQVADAVEKLTGSVRRLAAEIEGAEPEPEPEPEPEKPAAGGAGDAPRLIALNMVLDGASREEVARYLDENFELEDAGAVLDDVWKRAGN